MAINLVTKYAPHVDEVFKVESKKSLLTNQDYDWTGAHSIKVYKVTTSPLNDYDRAGTADTDSRYGDITSLGATTQEMILSQDKAFTFAIDKMDQDETNQAMQASTALARQTREIIIPTVDAYVYGKMCTNAGTKPDALALTADNIYDQIIAAGKTLDDAEVPETGRFLVFNPDSYVLMKKCPDIIMETDIGNELRLQGVIGLIDGAKVFKVPSGRLPAGFGFLLGHPIATVAPTKLEDYKIHQDPPGISGSLVEGRIVYDAFVLNNKAKALYYQATV
ncbi:MAG: hypothetical protein PWR12_693 [Eubacteriaceae bacterium]|jgi:hypothetical protein|nr:hypothetical protein [Eubacteriaceae bacterium]MDK2904617.1 hypothetical protein [Eubacteriaceae bacterium]MDK2935345.1 hypothetical protein [Eubacteriaceae bacterium]MDK2961605.1 hypothetical protein [Eubacteriaceae bacterium]